MQEYDKSVSVSGNTSGNVMSEPQRDDDMRSQMEHAIAEAAERVTFHRIELERYERIGRAAGLALAEIHATVPVQKADTSDFLHSDQAPALR